MSKLVLVLSWLMLLLGFSMIILNFALSKVLQSTQGVKFPVDYQRFKFLYIGVSIPLIFTGILGLLSHKYKNLYAGVTFGISSFVFGFIILLLGLLSWYFLSLIVPEDQKHMACES